MVAPVCNSRNTNYSITLSLKTVLLILIGFFIITFISFNIYSRNNERKKDLCRDFNILFNGSSEVVQIIMVVLNIVLVSNFAYFLWRSLNTKNVGKYRLVTPIILFIVSVVSIVITVVVSNNKEKIDLDNAVGVDEVVRKWCSESPAGMKLVWGCGIIFAIGLSGGIIGIVEWVNRNCVI